MILRPTILFYFSVMDISCLEVSLMQNTSPQKTLTGSMILKYFLKDPVWFWALDENSLFCQSPRHTRAVILEIFNIFMRLEFWSF